MGIKHSLTIGVGIAGLVVGSSLALYYRQQAADYEQQWQAASKELARLAAMPPSAPDAPPEVKTPTIHWNPRANSAPSPSREPEPQTAEKSPTPPANETPPPRPAESNRFGRRGADWMENLRTNDPQRYAEFQQRRQERQENMQNAWMQATNYFMNRDTSKMTQADAEEYNTMISLLGQAWTLNQQLQAGLPPEERQQVMSDLRSNVTAIVPLLDSERNREYYDMAVAMGQSQDAAVALVNAVNQITSNTSLRTILPGIRVGGGPGGPGGPGGSAPARNTPATAPSTR